MKISFKQEKLIRWLTFNPGLALTGFRTTRPRRKGLILELLNLNFNTITTGREPHESIEIKKTLFHGQHDKWHASCARAPIEEKRLCAEHCGQTPADTKSWFTAYIFDIGHPCYGQLTPIKAKYPLASITLSYQV